jgi:uncharacterized protein (DUF885 family)
VTDRLLQPHDPSADLARLAERYWLMTLEENPRLATAIGDRRFDHLLDDPGGAAIARRRTRLAALKDEAAALGDDALGEADRVTRAALLSTISADVDLLDARVEQWAVDPLEGPQVGFNDIQSYQLVRTPDDGRALVERYRRIGSWIDAAIENLRRCLEDGVVSVRDPVDRVIDELADLLARPSDTWAMARPAAAERPDWTTADVGTFRTALGEVIEAVARPAFERYREALATEIRPRARSSDMPGLRHVPGGEAAYDRRIRAHTSLEASARELHELGLAEVARIDAEIVDLGGRVLGTTGLAATLGRLRSDPNLCFATREEILAKAASAVRRADEALPDWFRRRPAAACTVVRMGDYEEKHSTIAYYRQPAVDGSRPGQYFVNTFEPATRPRYEAEALAYHESIPGHHVQMAVAQELDELPHFRRHLGPSAFVEGWALYAERLAAEMGLYGDDLDRLGVLSFDAWRACRLVVDTGMHALGWSRGEAIRYMVDHTALGENNIANEVDRYIVWPGQALAYKVGQLEFIHLREQARTRLADRFDIRDFHDIVLGQGSVSLPVLRGLVSGWLDRVTAG